MEFYTVILRESAGYYVALCLENGIVGQGDTQENAISKLKEAIESFEEIYNAEDDIYQAPIPISELHEFLTVEEQKHVKLGKMTIFTLRFQSVGTILFITLNSNINLLPTRN